MENQFTNISNLQNQLNKTDLTIEQLYEIAQSFYNNENTILNAIMIFNHIIDNHDQIYEILKDHIIKLLQNQDTRIQDITISIIAKLIPKQNLQSLSLQILNQLLDAIKWDFTFSTYHQNFKHTRVLIDAPFPDQKNQVKIIEPMFLNKYYFTNDKNQYLQGLLGAQELFLKNQYNFDKVIQNIEIIQRMARHQNKYVRLYALKFIHHLFPLYNGDYKEIINATLQQGLMDESLEVRIQALREYQTLNPIKKEQFLIPLLTNCHTENLMEMAANISNQQFPSQGGPPILGLITIIRDKFLKECLYYCYYCTTSRYFQIRASGLQTLQTIILFMKSIPNSLPYKEIIKVAQNCSLFETDPIVRQCGLSLMYHISRLHLNEISEFQEQIVQNCLFHISDVPYECKEYCAKILALFKDHVNLISLLEQKVQLLKDREAAFNDFVGILPNTPEAQQQLQLSIDSQGGKEKVTNKHQSQTLHGLALIFKSIAQLQPDEQLLKLLIIQLSSSLKYIDLHRHQILESVVEGLQELKIVKRLPIKLLDETDLLKYMQQYHENELLNKIGDIVGPTILKGRL